MKPIIERRFVSNGVQKEALRIGTFLGGMLAGIAFVIAAAVGAATVPAVQQSALELVLNNSEIYSLELANDIVYLRLRPSILTDALIKVFGVKPLCRRINLALRKDGPKFGWVTSAVFIDQTYAYHSLKGNITGDTPEIIARCIEGLDAPASTLSPDNTTIVVGGTIVTKDGKWTFGTATANGGNAILLNGSQAAGGFGATLLLLGGEIYTFTADSKWYHWLGMGWSQMASAPVAPTPPAPPAPAAPTYKVSVSGTATTRPLYDGALWAASATWKQIGTVPVGTACEPEVIRKTTVEYHYTTNASNLRGLAACAQGA